MNGGANFYGIPDGTRFTSDDGDAFVYQDGELVPAMANADPTGAVPHDGAIWHAHMTLRKWHGDWTAEQIDRGDAGEPEEVLEVDGNLLVIGGVSLLWQYAIGNGTTTAGQALTYLNNANAQIGIGDSTTAAADSQTDLVAATNKTYKAMDSGYPQHTDSTSAGGAKTITFRSTFGSGDANYPWAEWVIKNGTGGSSRILNRKVEAMGTKASGSTWQPTVTVTIN